MVHTGCTYDLALQSWQIDIDFSISADESPEIQKG
jgi:hypothetical protein